MSFRDWQVGDPVVCVETLPDDKGWGLSLPEVGSVYTLRKIAIATVGDPEPVVHLNEVMNRTDTFSVSGNPVYGEVCWPASWFRKVEPRKTSIAILERFLLNPNAPVREDA